MLSLLLALASIPATSGATSQQRSRAVCRTTDGDTLRCGRERIRLLAIDAPELPGHCRRGRRCTPGDPFASRRSMAALLRCRTSVTITASTPTCASPLIRRVGIDRYGRTLATVSVNGNDLSCAQLANGMAIYRSDWDNRRLVARTCPATVRTAGAAARR